MTIRVPEQQSVDAKRAEANRPFSGDHIFQDPKLISLHRERSNAILADLKTLEEKHITFNPFLEIGAGGVQRSAALINNYPADGVATDISLKSMQDAPYVLSLLNYSQMPELICCDAHHLPFLPNTFLFVFAYQTLHHFENPIPVVSECYRVLGKGGYFFFNEEPMDSSFRRLLRGNRMLSHPPTNIQRLGFRLGVQKVFWDDGAHERSLGITEARFDLNLWRRALQDFVIVDIEVNRKLRIHSDLEKPTVNGILSSVIGGNVKGLCLKAEGEVAINNFRERMICLDCNSARLSQVEDKQLLLCKNCSRSYPITDGIIRMLPKELEDELYPN